MSLGDVVIVSAVIMEFNKRKKFSYLKPYTLHSHWSSDKSHMPLVVCPSWASELTVLATWTYQKLQRSLLRPFFFLLLSHSHFNTWTLCFTQHMTLYASTLLIVSHWKVRPQAPHLERSCLALSRSIVSKSLNMCLAKATPEAVRFY